MILQEHRSYRGLPALAGVCSMSEAAKPGLSVEDCVRRHKRAHYAFKRLQEIFTARLTAEPIYELKMAFSLHAHLCAEHAASIRNRVGEMREPPLGLEAVPDPHLETFFDEILGTPTTEELVVGLYKKAIPALEAALKQHLADTNHLADHPSVRLCRFALLELADMADFGEKTVRCLVDQKCREGMADWVRLLDDCLAAAGGVEGKAAVSQSDSPTDAASRGASPARRYSAEPYRYDPVPRRDERFPDPYNMGVNAESFLYDPKFPAHAKVLMMFYKRLREVDVPEMMASILTETKGKPWDYYRDMVRQLWDEARHAMMGEVGFADLGLDWPRLVMVNHTWSLGLNTQLEPWERHAVLYFIEQGLMPKTGKRFEWEVAVASTNPIAALFQDYDWADEVLHARIGRAWYVPEFESAAEAIKYGDECWSKVLMNWKTWKERGLTKHRNWWPELYKEACEKSGIEPDPQALAFHETYETTRADLKQMTGSA
jgi:hypothetical protein